MFLAARLYTLGPSLVFYEAHRRARLLQARGGVEVPCHEDGGINAKRAEKIIKHREEEKRGQKRSRRDTRPVRVPCRAAGKEDEDADAALDVPAI